MVDDGYGEWLAKTKPGVALDIFRWQKAGKSPKEIADLLFEHSTIARGMKLAYNDVPKWLGGPELVPMIAQEISRGRSGCRPDNETAKAIVDALKTHKRI